MQVSSIRSDIIGITGTWTRQELDDGELGFNVQQGQVNPDFQGSWNRWSDATCQKRTERKVKEELFMVRILGKVVDVKPDAEKTNVLVVYAIGFQTRRKE